MMTQKFIYLSSPFLLSLSLLFTHSAQAEDLAARDPCNKSAYQLEQDDILSFSTSGNDPVVQGIHGVISIRYPDSKRERICRITYCHNFNPNTQKPDSEKRCFRIDNASLDNGVDLIPGAPDTLKISSSNFNEFHGGNLVVILGRKQNAFGKDLREWTLSVERNQNNTMSAHFGPNNEQFDSLNVNVRIGRAFGRITSGELKSADLLLKKQKVGALDLLNLPSVN